MKEYSLADLGLDGITTFSIEVDKVYYFSFFRNLD